MLERAPVSWNEVILRDPTHLSGASLLSLLEVIGQAYDTRYVAVRRVEGADLGPLEQAWEPRLYDVREFTGLCAGVRQFDWGDFQCFDHQPVASALDVDVPYPDLIRLAGVTIRAVDDAWFYIYTQLPIVMSALRNAYSELEVHTGALEEFVFPE
jgi:hypothetical protein